MRRGALGLTTAVLSTLLLGAGLAAPSAADTTTYAVPATGKVTIAGHGWGHGHGMSQYGAQGAALQGLTWQQIVAFYYPGTAQTTLSRTVRVKITADTSSDVLVGPRPGLTVTDSGTNEVRTLPANGADRWRLVVATGNQTGVEYRIGSTWTRWWTFAADGSFFAANKPIRLYYAGTSHLFRGRLTAARPSAASTDRDTVNRLSLENYIRGVVPAEMPSSWAPAAVAAQAVAARSYAAWDLSTPSAETHFDICDTTQCQVYGGFDREAAASNAAINATAGVILTYNGARAFTQFSSSSGGWTSAGSVPYLTAKADPYDGWKRADGTYGNANHDWTVTPDVSQIEKAFGFANLTSITMTRNDGHHVSKLTLTGTANSKAKTVTTYGDTFRGKLGLKSTYFRFVPPPPAPTPTP
jgi:stage II sporulation protein D